MEPDEQAITIESSQALLGKVLEGKYRIDALVASGAMGGVYAGTHLDLGKKVAIKVLHPWLAQDMRSLQRFLQEARAICSLSHPNVVAVYRCGRDGNCIYIAMEYLEGESLAERIKRRGALPVDEAVYIVSEAAAGLAHAHGENILHRDVKPSNIMLGTADSANVHVVDFGIAKFSQLDLDPQAAQQQALTSTNATVGTPYYMSPEQGSRQELDHRTDIYSLGCVLYEALTGKVPFPGDSAFAIMLAHTTDQAPTMPKQIPMWLQSVVAKAMAKDRGQRYQSMEEFRQALLERQAAQSVVRRRKKRTRNTAIVVGTACALGAIASCAFFFLEPKSAPQPADLPSDVRRLEAIERFGKEGQRLWEAGQPAQASNFFVELKKVRDEGPQSRRIESTAWQYMPLMVLTDLALERLNNARDDAKYFVDSTRQYEGTSSITYARALGMLADVEYDSFNLREARRLFEESISIADHLHSHNGTEEVWRNHVYAETMSRFWTLDPKAAQITTQKVVDNYVIKKLPNVAISQAEYGLACAYANQRKWPEALEHLHRSNELVKGAADDVLHSVLRIETVGGVARNHRDFAVALKLADEGQRLSLRLPAELIPIHLTANRSAQIMALSRMGRLAERDRLLAQYIAEAPDENSRGIYSDLCGVIYCESKQFDKALVALEADIAWDLKHRASDQSLFDDYQRLGSVKLELGDRAGFKQSLKMMEKYATTEPLKARLHSISKDWGLTKLR